jgi:uncharacterized membrane protein
VLVLVNVLSINLSALVVLWYMGYRPQYWFWKEYARRDILKRGVTLAVAIAVLSMFLVGVTYDSFQRATTEEQIQDDVDEAVVAFDSDHRLERIDVNILYPSSVPFQDPERVVVRVGIEPGESATGLAAAIGDRIETTTGEEVAVEVQYIDSERIGVETETET